MDSVPGMSVAIGMSAVAAMPCCAEPDPHKVHVLGKVVNTVCGNCLQDSSRGYAAERQAGVYPTRPAPRPVAIRWGVPALIAWGLPVLVAIIWPTVLGVLVAGIMSGAIAGWLRYRLS